MNGRYYSLNDYLKEKFGEKIYKLSIDLGLTCPNRDGRLHTRGCIFCLGGSSHFASRTGDIHQKIESAKELVAKKTKAEKFIAYFQSYTNTYADVNYLRQAFMDAISRADIVALSIATRPDCLPPEIVDLLAELNQIKPVWVELGLQSSKPETVRYIRRCYDNSVYREAVKSLSARGIEVITHIIIGPPHETKEDVLNTLRFALNCGTRGIKLQLLHVLRGTDLCTDYENGRFNPLSIEEYMDILFDCIRNTPKDVVIHRITGDAPKIHLVAPLWSADKKRVINTISREMNLRNVIQGESIE